MSRPFYDNVHRMYKGSCGRKCGGCNECDREEVVVEYVEETQCQPVQSCRGTVQEMYIPVDEACERVEKVMIPHTNVRTLGEARSFPNHFVFVEETQQWYHMDEYGNGASMSNSNLYLNNFNPTEHEGLYKKVMVFDFANETAYVYNASGQYASWKINVQQNVALGGN